MPFKSDKQRRYMFSQMPDIAKKWASENSDWKDQLPGGDADKGKPSQFDPEQLALGAQEELEHTDDGKKAIEIAMDHLIQDPDYYKKLSKVESRTVSIKSLYSMMGSYPYPNEREDDEE